MNINMHDTHIPNYVIPAKAGIQRLFGERHWIPAFAGMTRVTRVVIHFDTAR